MRFYDSAGACPVPSGVRNDNLARLRVGPLYGGNVACTVAAV
jgi:hypothetical protein